MTSFQKTKEQALREIGFDKRPANRLETLAKHPEIVAQAKAEAREQDDIVRRSFVLEKIKAKEKAEQIAQAKESIASQTKQTDNRPIIHLTDSRTFNVGEKYDLLLTDPPYSTDVPDLEAFIDGWLFKALGGVNHPVLRWIICYLTVLSCHAWTQNGYGMDTASTRLLADKPGEMNRHHQIMPAKATRSPQSALYPIRHISGTLSLEAP